MNVDRTWMRAIGSNAVIFGGLCGWLVVHEGLTRLGLAARVPLAVYAPLLVATWAGYEFLHRGLARAGWPRRTTVALSILLVTPVVYATGWGGATSIGYLILVPAQLNRFGTAAVRPLVIWTSVGIFAGQLAVAAGIAPAMIPPAQLHGLSANVAVGVLVGILFAGRTARGKELAEEELRRAEEQFRSLVQHSSDVVAIVGDDDTLRYVSPASRSVLGADPEALQGRRVDELVHADDADALRDVSQVTALDVGTRTVEVRLLHGDGTWRWCEVALTDHAERPGIRGIVANIRDVSERKLLEAQLEYDAYHDRLTGLLNRARFVDRLVQALARSRRRGDMVAVLFVDLDGFKPVNDERGHDAGDAVLTATAERLRAVLRPEDTLARFGGDEFTVLLEDVRSPEAATDVAHRLVAAMAAPLQLPGHGPVAVGASVGVASDRGGQVSGEELLRRADLAMYLAKRAGAGQWRMFEDGAGWSLDAAGARGRSRA